MATEWLQGWADADIGGDTSGEAGGVKGEDRGVVGDGSGVAPLDNSLLLCPHGKLDPVKAATGT